MQMALFGMLSHMARIRYSYVCKHDVRRDIVAKSVDRCLPFTMQCCKALAVIALRV